MVTTIAASASATCIREDVPAEREATVPASQDPESHTQLEAGRGGLTEGAQGDARRTDMASPAEHSVRDQARDWLRQQGPIGNILLALADALAEDRLTVDARPRPI